MYNGGHARTAANPTGDRSGANRNRKDRSAKLYNNYGPNDVTWL
jgi:hypothetical protein